jgi:hypothetical protein
MASVSKLVGQSVTPCFKGFRDLVNMAFSVIQPIFCPVDRVIKANNKITDKGR